MLWLKRNVFLVIGGLVALGLLGFAGYFLYTNLQSADAVSVNLNTRTEELKALMTRDPHPGTDKVDNIGAAKREQQRLLALLSAARMFFANPPAPKPLDSAQFKGLLENTIFELTRDAESAGVNLPPKYSFTFAAERPLVQFAPGSLDPLAAQLGEIKAICEILFNAKTHSLIGLRRVAASADDPAGAPDYLTSKSTTNSVAGATITPYEITFQGFSSELGAVLAGFTRSPMCFIVKVVNVDHTAVGGTETSAAADAMAVQLGLPPPITPNMSPAEIARRGEAMMRQRYHLGPKPPTPSTPVTSTAPATTATPNTRSGPVMILDEKPLKITISLQVVKLKPAK